MTVPTRLGARTRYDDGTPVDVPIEVVFSRAGSGNQHLQLRAWCTPQGIVAHMLDNGLGGTPMALSNLQPSGPLFPGKAVPGWQAEVVAFAGQCLYPIETIR